MLRRTFLRALAALALATPLLAPVLSQPAAAADVTLLNVSYDPTRELYQDIDAAFARHWKARTGDKVTVKQSHGGSGKQARAVIDGLPADVVTLALAYDIDAISEKGRIAPSWQGRLARRSSPYTSTIVFLVRKGNPMLALRELGPDRFEIVAPSLSILAEPPVAVIDRNVDKKGTRKVAQAYLEFLYTDEGQDIVAKNYYRPAVDKFAKKYASHFRNVKLFPISELGGWTQAQKAHFADGGLFDQIYQPGR